MVLYRFLFAPVLLAIAVILAPGQADRPAPRPSREPASLAGSPEPARPAMPAALDRATRPRPVRAR